MTKECLNCGKDITVNAKMPESSKFCSRACSVEYRENKQKHEKAEFFKMELNLLEKSVGKRVELGLSRGSNVKGTVVGFDERFGKIAVKVTENNQTKTVVVRLGYIISFAVYDWKEKHDEAFCYSF